jgi:hypothetical protein
VSLISIEIVDDVIVALIDVTSKNIVLFLDFKNALVPNVVEPRIVELQSSAPDYTDKSLSVEEVASRCF